MEDRGYAYDPVSTGSVGERRYKMEEGQLWRQYVIAAVANIVITATGYCMGWTSPINSILSNPNATTTDVQYPNDLSVDELAWIGSLLPVGAIFGPFIGGLAASHIGRKWGLISASVPLFIGWILVGAAYNVGMLYAARIFWGLAVGMAFTLTPMYCAEISTDESRGALGSFLQVFVVVGFLIIYVVGPYTDYYIITYLGVAVVVVFDIMFFFMPESPFYYLLKNDREGAAESLAKIRGKSVAAVEEELSKMAADVAASQEKTANFSDLFSGANFKALYISSFLVFSQQFCGINAVLFYMSVIFDAANSTLDSAIATIIIGAVQVGASCVTPFVVDRLGRRLLLLFSCVGTTLGLGLLGMYFLLSAMESPAVSSIGFIPVLSLVIFIVTYCVGLGPLPWAVMGELFPMEVKAIAAPLATAFCWMLSFLITRFFSPVAEALGMYVVFWFFGVCCVISFVFVMFFVPETKGKSFQEIQDMLSGRKSKPGKA